MSQERQHFNSLVSFQRIKFGLSRYFLCLLRNLAKEQILHELLRIHTHTQPDVRQTMDKRVSATSHALLAWVQDF